MTAPLTVSSLPSLRSKKNGTSGNDNLSFAGQPLGVDLDLGTGNDLASGSSFADVILGGAGNDQIYGNDGNDVLDGGDGNDRLDGGLGNDTLRGGNGNDQLSGGQGNDLIIAGDGNDQVWGGQGDDTLDAGFGNDTVYGEDGNDTFIHRLGEGKGDVYWGGNGADTLRVEVTAAEWAGRADVRADILRLATIFAQRPWEAESLVNLKALGVSIGGFERLDLRIDGVSTNPIAPTPPPSPPAPRPVSATADLFAVTEDGQLSGSLVGNDTVPEGGIARVEVLGSPVVGLSLLSDGSFAFDPNQAHGHLASGEVSEVAFRYRLTGTNGTTSEATATIRVTGSNDGPVAHGVETTQGFLAETPGQSTSATLLQTQGAIGFSDADLGDGHLSHSALQTTSRGDGGNESLGTLTLSAHRPSGSAAGQVVWTYTVEDKALDFLRAGDQVTEVHRVTISDGHGGTLSRDVTIVMTGSNDGPIALVSDGIRTVSAGSSLRSDLAYGLFADPDAGDRLSVTATLADGSALPAWLQFDAATGLLLGEPRSSDRGVIDIAVTATDLSGAAASNILSMQVEAISAAAVELSAIAAGEGGFKILGRAGQFGGAMTGASLTSLGDINEDGRGDFAVGSGGEAALFVIYGKDDGNAVDLSQLAASQGYAIAGTLRDGTAVALAAAGDQTGDGHTDILVGLPGSGGGRTGGAALISTGLSGSITALAGPDRLTAGQTSRDEAGLSVAGGLDVNADGRADMVVGAPGFSGGSAHGAVYVLFGQTAGGLTTLQDASMGHGGFRVDGEGLLDRAGTSVALAADMNGDGRAEVLIGARDSDSNGPDAGAVYVLWGRDASAPVSLADVTAGTAGYRIRGEAPQDGAGLSVSSIGDLNGDGRGEVLIGAIFNDQGGTSAGAAYVAFGKSDGTEVNLSDVARGVGGFKIIGEESYAYTGVSLSSISDLNGDGLQEILVGTQMITAAGAHAGAAYIVWGQSSTRAIHLGDVAEGYGGLKIVGENDFDYAGIQVRAADDMNGDGRQEILIGAPGQDTAGEDAGSTYVIFSSSDWIGLR